MNPLRRHSCEGRNPVSNQPAQRTKFLIPFLDSRFRENDGVLHLRSLNHES